MKSIFVILFFATTNLAAHSKYNQIGEKISDIGFIQNDVTYRLFPTQNMWTFIKLNTRTGQMWQVQFDIKGDNRHEVYLTLESLVTFEEEANDRFTLYPTENMYTFILLDQHTGKTWQTQWSMEAENRGIIPIE